MPVQMHTFLFLPFLLPLFLFGCRFVGRFLLYRFLCGSFFLGNVFLRCLVLGGVLRLLLPIRFVLLLDLNTQRSVDAESD